MAQRERQPIEGVLAGRVTRAIDPRLLPLLALYVGVVLLALRQSHLNGFLVPDEQGYFGFARNLSQGFYSPRDNINLWWGPGYPLLLLPFVLLHLPLAAARLLNAALLFGGIVYFHHLLRCYVPARAALFGAYLLGLYPRFVHELPLLLTETLTIALLCAFGYYFCLLQLAVRQGAGHRRLILPIAGLLAYLALTKVVFGYVIAAALIICLICWSRGRALHAAAAVCACALLLCTPYLIYTYSLTGKVFYWGNSGGVALYWMSSPYDEEVGDFRQPEDVTNNPNLIRHRAFYEQISQLPSIAQDDALKQQALANIRAYPVKYLKNWLANICRLLFSFPASYTPQRLPPLTSALPNLAFLIAAVACIYPSLVGRRSTPPELYMLLALGILAFGANSLLSAAERYFHALIPLFSAWIIFTMTRLVRLGEAQE
jgi:hypothetical protein